MVNRKRNYTLHFYLMAVLVAIAIGCVNFLGMEYNGRFDLTADRRFTLSEGTQRLFEKLGQQPVLVTYYVDEELPSERVNLSKQVTSKLEELASLSDGNLTFKVDRIPLADVSTRRKELDDLGIRELTDVTSPDGSDRTQIRGGGGYFSSVVVRYGRGESEAVNGIVNVVKPEDELAEHRVDTLEFDIAYAVVRLRNDTRKPSFERLLRLQEKQLRFRLYVSEQMPEDNPSLGENLHRVLEEIKELAPRKVDYSRRVIEFGIVGRVEYPFGDEKREVDLMPVMAPAIKPGSEPIEERRVNAYYANVLIQAGDDESVNIVYDFSETPSAAEIRTLLEDTIWEMVRPRNRVGFVLPPAPPAMGQQQQGTGHEAIANHVRGELGYDAEIIDVQAENGIPGDLACLFVMEANVLSERVLYEIDRYLASGGNVVMMVQAWDGELDLGVSGRNNMTLRKQNMQPHFEEWAAHYGVSFGQDMLLRKNALMQPYVMYRDRMGRVRGLDPVPSTVRLAPLAEPDDLNTSSVFTRGISSLPFPFVVETDLDDERIDELGLERTDLITFQGEVFRFIPENPTFPQLPLDLSLSSSAEVENDPSAEPDEGVRAQKLADAPVVATWLTGDFPSYWRSKELNVPGWEGEDPSEEQAPEILSAKPGNLVVVSSAGMLNVRYFYGYKQGGEFETVIRTGVNFFRNTTEGFVYGEDIVNLRARSGVAPRIVGPVSDEMKVFWFLVCIGGMPFILLLLAGARAYVYSREREDYEVGIGIREEK